MRSRLSLLGAALVSMVVVYSVATPGAFAAGGRGKASARKAAAARAAADAAKKKTAELLVDERAINKQMQWEDKVMGSNSAKKAELAKIARAQAITKAAEQAAAEKAASAPVAAAPKPNKAPVNLPTLADEGDRNGKKDDSVAKNRELSAKLATPEAAASGPAPKPGDDKFIDKILASDGNKKKSAKTNTDGELEQLLAKDSDKAGGKRKAKRKDSVDDLLDNAGKAAEPPLAVKASRNADIERMEPLPTPPPMAPVAIKKLASFKRDDGIIHVVQGANYSVPSAAANRSPVVAAVPAKPPEAPPNKATNWKDPFADSPSATRKVDVSREEQKQPASPEAPPSHPPGWKDPFSENTLEQPAAAGDAHGHELSTTAPAAVAADPPEPKGRMSAHHRVARSRAAVDGRSRWSVLKKR